MAYYNDGKTFRNLPEQVDKNKTDIEEMQSTVEADEKNINDNMNKILAHDTRINALETTKLNASNNSIKLTRSNAEMGSVSIAKVGGNTLVNGNDIPLATINGESIMQNKDFTIDSNLSNLLWANLGIGRWANQTFVPLTNTSTITFIDNLIPHYTSRIRMCYGVHSDFPLYLNEDLNYIGWGLDNSIFRNSNISEIHFKNVSLSGGGLFANCSASKIVIEDGYSGSLKRAGYWQVGMFENCSNLEEIGSFDMSDFGSANEIHTIFYNCLKLKSIHCTHWKVSFNISYSTAFETEDLVEIISNLDPVTTTQTLTMGATNLAKLSSSDILIATGKGWQLA